jgi:hypothetical protein
LAGTLARIYEPETRQWRVLDATLKYGRVGPVVVRAGDQILVVGGRLQDKRGARLIERFDPLREKFVEVGKLASGRRRPEVTVLTDGRVLVTGESLEAEILEPHDNGTWKVRLTKGRTAFLHRDHVAVLLADGSVLLVGGCTKRLERFDPATEEFTACQARLDTVLDDQAAMLLYDGRVLLAGGQNVYSNESVAAYWLYDPAADRLERHHMDWAGLGISDLAAVDVWAADPARRGRWILLCGGEYDPGRGEQQDMVLDAAWVYDAAAGRMVVVGPMTREHDEFVAIPISHSGTQARVVIVGGYGRGDSFEAGCEEFVWWWDTRPGPGGAGLAPMSRSFWPTRARVLSK